MNDAQFLFSQDRFEFPKSKKTGNKHSKGISHLSTRNGRARVYALVPDARELPGAVSVLVALLLPAVGPPGAPGDVGVAAAAPGALAQEGPGTVDADGAAAARAVQALVHVLAARQRVPSEALLAEALRGAGGGALGVQAAAEAVAGALAAIAVLKKIEKKRKY